MQFIGGIESKTQKPFPRFLVKLSELCPRLVHKQMVVLQKHLDSDVSQTTRGGSLDANTGDSRI